MTVFSLQSFLFFSSSFFLFLFFFLFLSSSKLSPVTCHAAAKMKLTLAKCTPACSWTETYIMPQRVCLQLERSLRHAATCTLAAVQKSTSACRNVHACSWTEVYVRMQQRARLQLDKKSMSACRNVHACSWTEVYVMPQRARLQLDRSLLHAATCTLAAGQKSTSCRNVHACSWTEVYVMPQRARLQLDRSLPSVIIMSCSCPTKPRVTQQSQRAKELLKRLHGSESV